MPKSFLGVCGDLVARLGVCHSFQITTRMKLLFSNCLGNYRYSFQGSSELISITVTVSLFFPRRAQLQEIFLSPQEFSIIFCNCSYMI